MLTHWYEYLPLTHWYEYLPAAWFTPEGRWCKEEREPRGTSHNL